MLTRHLILLSSILNMLMAAALPAQSSAAVGGNTEGAAVSLKIGTHIPLSLLNSVSTKHSASGDRVYMETVFPIMLNGRIVIPPGSYVAGTLTQVKRPGRVRGKGELFLRFDTLTLPNGVTRDFRARLSAVDGAANETLERREGKVIGDSNKGGDVRTVGEATAAGASAGVLLGSVAKNVGMGAGIGAGAGAAAGIMGVLLSRGPDAVLAKGSTIEMVLDRPIDFTAEELNLAAPATTRRFSDTTPAAPKREASAPRTRLPF
jgi:hypothetical protein